MRQHKDLIKIDLFAKINLTLAAIVLIFLIKLIFIDQSYEIDIYFENKAIQHRGNTLSRLMIFFTNVGDYETMITMYLIIISVLLFYLKQQTLAIKVTLTAFSTLWLMYGLKFLFKRDRPIGDFMLDAEGYSFPSGHTMNSFVLFFVLIFLSDRYVSDRGTRNFLKMLFILIPTAISFSRVYVGVHFFTDIAAGLCFGYIWFYISNILLDYMLYPKTSELKKTSPY